DNKDYVIKNEHNRSLINHLIEVNGKNRNEHLRTRLVVAKELYKIMSQRQIMSLISRIQIKREIPVKYSYLGQGAKYWDKQYSSKAYSSRFGNSNTYFLNSLYTIITDYFEDEKINVIDIGAGNSEPTLPFLKRLIDEDRLNKYVTIDISKTMLAISKQHFLKAGLEEKYLVQRQLDYESNSIDDFLYEMKSSGREAHTPNLLLMLDSSLGNTNTPNKVLQTIQSGMFSNDFLCISSAHDNVKTRGVFQEYESKDNHKRKLYIPHLLGLSKKHYEIEKVYNEILKRKEYNLIMKEGVTIVFDQIETKPEVSLLKGEKLNLWYYQRDTVSSINDKANACDLEIRMVLRNPKASSIIYMLGLE
ncbi:MAG: class I SAM-dependent methyltransferase, partial [Bacteroidota bacterium]